MARQRTRPDGRRATFEAQYAFHLRQLTAEHFPDSAPSPSEQARLELGALISARLDRLRLEMFEAITDDSDQKLIALTRSLTAVTKQFATIRRRAERAPTIAEYLTEVRSAKT